MLEVDRRAMLLVGGSGMALGALSGLCAPPALAEYDGPTQASKSAAAPTQAKPAAAPSQGKPAPAPSQGAGPVVYSDSIDKFSLTVPTGWARGEGAIGGAQGFTGATGARRTLAFFPDDPAVHDVNIIVVITNVSVEFTKLGSFGNVDTFAGNLVNSLDRSFLLKGRSPPTEPVQIAKLVDYSATGDAYNVEYTVQKLPGPQRHLFSTVILGSNGTYNRLYTVTAQCLEEDLPRFKAQLQGAIKSFTAEVKPMF